METIETIFENYKASHNEETPQTEEQRAGLQELETALLRQCDFSGKGIRKGWFCSRL